MKRSSTVLALAATVAATLVSASPATAAQLQPVQDPATITLTGNGYGHGWGMSQYGAYGAARRD